MTIINGTPATAPQEDADTSADDLRTDAVGGFQKMSGDEGSVEKYGVDDQIAAIEYKRRDTARGLFLAAFRKASGRGKRINPPSGVGQ